MESSSAARSAYDRIQLLLQQEQVRRCFNDFTNGFVSWVVFVAVQKNNSSPPISPSRIDINQSSILPDVSTLTVAPFVANEVQSLADNSNEEIFHALLLDYVNNHGLVVASDLADFSSIVGKFSECMNHLQNLPSSSVVISGKSKALHNERRTERDFWSLLQVLSVGDVIGDIDEHACEQKLTEKISALQTVVTIPHYINTALTTDLRFKKGRILKDWLESSSKDNVIEIPTPKAPPLFETLCSIVGTNSNLSRGKSQLQTVDPDAQLSADKGLLALVGDDQTDQEALLMCIWQLIRSGQVDKAQILAYEHRAFWLASSLRGFDPHQYESMEQLFRRSDVTSSSSMFMDDEDHDITVESVTISVRKGNPKLSLWLQTTYNYAQSLYQSLRQGASLATILEMTIFAALSNHQEALKESPLISSWYDRLWVYVNGTYHRDLMRIYQRYYDAKVQHSIYYPGCDAQTLQQHAWLLQEYDRTVQGSVSSHVAQVVPSPSGPKLECVLMRLQLAFMSGITAVRAFFAQELQGLLHPRDAPTGHEDVLRVLIHVLLWCRLSPTALSASLADIVSQDVYYHAIEVYIDHLIARQQYGLVALYARFLSPHRRVHAYAILLLKIQYAHVSHSHGPNHADDREAERAYYAKEAMQLAHEQFPEDVPDITRRVMEESRRGQRPGRVATTTTIELEGDEKRGQTPLLNTSFDPKRNTMNNDSSSHNTNSGLVGDDDGILQRFLSSKSNTAAATKQKTNGSIITPSKPQQSQHLSEGASELLSPSSSSALVKFTPKTDRPAQAAEVLTEADRLMLESLRWVALESSTQEDEAQTVECLRAVHRVLTSLLVDSHMEKVHLLPIILKSYLHAPHLINRVEQHLEHLEMQARQRDHLSEDEYRQRTQLVLTQWHYDKDIHSLWSVLAQLQEETVQWRHALYEPLRDLQRSLALGQATSSATAVPSIRHYATLCQLVNDQLLPRIEGLFVVVQEDNPASREVSQGLVTVLQGAQQVAKECVSSLVTRIFELLQSDQQATSSLTGAQVIHTQHVVGAERAKDDASLLAVVMPLVHELEERFRQEETTLLQGNDATTWQTVVSMLRHEFDTSTTTTRKKLASETLFSLLQLLQLLSQRVKDHIDTAQFLQMLVHYLLQLYLTICLRTSEAMTLFCPANTTNELVSRVAETRAQILEKAVKLSNTIASEDPTLRLYSFLSTYVFVFVIV